MRHPITDMTRNLCWTQHGVVWATWRITPAAYGRRPVKEKRAVKNAHRSLLRSLNGEALLLGVLVDVDPVTVVEAQIAGVDLSAYPEWAAEAEANLDRLTELPLGRRAFYLSVPLPNQGQQRWRTPVNAALGRVRETLQLPRSHPSQEEVQARLAQAAQVTKTIPALFGAHPVSVAEQVWLGAHAQRRGMVDMPPPEQGDALAEQLLTTTSGVAVPEPVLDEGAISDLTGKGERRPPVVNPMSRRVLKVQDPREVDLGQPPSYQCLMVLADTPAGGMVFPGSEFLGRLDAFGVDVDWAVRLRIHGRDRVMRKNAKASKNLSDQYDQRDTGQASGSTGHPELDAAAQLLVENQATMSTDRNEVEVEHTVIFAVAATQEPLAQERARDLARAMAEESDLRLERPVGAQEQLWWAMQPGVPSTRVVRSYSQYATGDSLAMSVPFTTTRLGGRRGQTIALNISSSRADVVHQNLAGYPRMNKSGAVAVCGELGAGKSYLLKTLASGLVDQGGQMLAIDRTAEGEWATLAGALTRRVVVDPGDPRWSMDPLRVLGIEHGSLPAQSFCTQLLNTSPQEPRGITLGQVLSTEYLREHHLASLGAVVTHLVDGQCPFPEAQDIGTHLRNYARLHLGRVIFDEALDPVIADEPAVVWRTHGMEQPTAAELAQPHLYRSLRPEKIFGRAYYHLIVATARRWAFADRARPVALVTDECHDIFSNPENDKELELFVREGRRALALLFLGSHDPDHDFGSSTLRALIPTRVAMRATDAGLAAGFARFLGVDSNDPEFALLVEDIQALSPVDPVTEKVPVERMGEGFMRDVFGGIGAVKILGPARQDRAVAIDTTPPEQTASVSP